MIDAAAAHPLGEPYALPVSPLLAAYGVGALVLALALAVPARPRGDGAEGGGGESWRGRLTRPLRATRTAAVALLGLAIAAGRLGVDDELENLAPALVVGTLWPLLPLACLVAGPVWRWVDPWDALARVLGPGRDGAAEREPSPERESSHVWPAVAMATVWAWYLGAYPDPLGPRAVGALLALYTLVTVGGCLALGRARWLGTAEPFGIVLSWMALLPRGRLGSWRPPRGAPALLGALIGGVLFGAVRRSELWLELDATGQRETIATAGVLAACAVGALIVTAIGGSVRPAVTRAAVAAPAGAARAAVTRAAVPATAGVILAVALDRNRLLTSVQLLPGLLGDPLGRGWDLLGRGGAGLDPEPFGITGLLVLQLGALTAGYAVGALVLGRSLARRARLPAAAGLALLAFLSVITIASH